MSLALHTTHQQAARDGIRIEQITIGWMIIEASLTIGAGIAAHSLLLIAFGLDSVIELITGGILLWQLTLQLAEKDLVRVEQAERRAAWVIAVALIALCCYIVVDSLLSLIAQIKPESSALGLVVAGIAVIGMPVLARRKRQLAATLNSAALRGDAACSMTCAVMAATLFVGLACNALFGWWWADSVAALVFLWYLVPAAREALVGARAGKGACACGDEACDD